MGQVSEPWQSPAAVRACCGGSRNDGVWLTRRNPAAQSYGTVARLTASQDRYVRRTATAKTGKPVDAKVGPSPRGNHGNSTDYAVVSPRDGSPPAGSLCIRRNTAKKGIEL